MKKRIEIVEVEVEMKVPGGIIVIEMVRADRELIRIQALPCLPDGSRDDVILPGWCGDDSPMCIWERE